MVDEESINLNVCSIDVVTLGALALGASTVVYPRLRLSYQDPLSAFCNAKKPPARPSGNTRSGVGMGGLRLSHQLESEDESWGGRPVRPGVCAHLVLCTDGYSPSQRGQMPQVAWTTRIRPPARLRAKEAPCTRTFPG